MTLTFSHGRRVVNSRNSNVLVENLEWARTFKERSQGLLGREELPEGKGLWIKKSGNSIHTFFMKFPIDLAFIGKDGVVKYTAHNVRPWRMIFAPLLRQTDCLELPAGTLAKTDTRKGDRLDVKS